jgi:hypothetical protein
MKILIVAIFLLFGIISQSYAGDVLGTNYSYKIAGTELTFYLHSEFSLGTWSSCPKIHWVQTKKLNDTIFIEAIYDIRGAWTALGCGSNDTINYTNLFSDVNYVNVSTNYVKGPSSTPEKDTIWNLYDTTFVLGGTSVSTIYRNDELLTVYPNPTTSFVSVQALENVNWRELFIYNELGQIVIRKSIKEMNGAEQIDIGGVASGMYLMELYDENKNKVGMAKFYKRNE